MYEDTNSFITILLQVNEARKNFLDYLLQVAAKYRKQTNPAISVAVDTAILTLGVQVAFALGI